MRSTHLAVAPPALAIALTLAAAAHAQNALGNGSLQGANEAVQAGQRVLRTPGATVYPQVGPTRARRPNYNQDLAFRNAIVTGNIGGGLNFRGELGYAGTFDFRGELGSDDIFDFQRRSIPASNASLLGTAPIPQRVSPAQQSLGYTIAGQQSALGGSPIIRRPGSGFTSAEVLGETDASIPGVDIYGRVQGGLRAPSAFQQRADTAPSIVGVAQSTEGEQVILLSNELMGVKAFNADGFGDMTVSRDQRARDLDFPESLTDLLRARREAREADAQAEADPTKIDPTDVTEQVEPLPTTAAPYQRVIEQLRLRNPELPTPAAPTIPDQPTIDNPIPLPGDDDPDDPLAEPEPIDPYGPINLRLDDLRDALSGTRPPTGSNEDEPTDGAPNVPGVRPGPDATGVGTSPKLEPPRGLNPVNEARKLLGLEPISVVRLTDPDSMSTLFDEHVAVGEAHLREGRYFDAEERFTAALMLQPGDPFASAGRVLSQISAGMYLSGELNLRSMLVAYPELAIVNFDERLLPGQERRERILDQLRERSRGPSHSARAAGLLLAYLGRQLDNRADIEAGFAEIDRVNKRLGVNDDTLIEVLRVLWLAEDAAPDE